MSLSLAARRERAHEGPGDIASSGGARARDFLVVVSCGIPGSVRSACIPKGSGKPCLVSLHMRGNTRAALSRRPPSTESSPPTSRSSVDFNPRGPLLWRRCAWSGHLHVEAWLPCFHINSHVCVEQNLFHLLHPIPRRSVAKSGRRLCI